MLGRASGNTTSMPDRAIIPLMPAVALGFICGLIASVTQMQTGAALAVAVCGGVIVLLAGTASVFGTKGESGEKAAVAGLRALSAVALFACIFLFMRSFLGDGSILIGLVWLVLAGVFGLLLAQLRIRDRKPLAQQRQEREEEAEREGRIYRESDEYDADADGEDADDRERSTTA
jgi:hypothetical protein